MYWDPGSRPRTERLTHVKVVNRESQVHCRLCVRGSEAEEGVEAGDGEERMSMQEPIKLRLDLLG